MANLQNWTEGIAMAVLFVIVFGAVIAGMNAHYSQDHEIVGVDTSSFEESLMDYQEGVDEKIRGGDASFTSAVGLTVSTSWDVIVSTLNLIWGFLTGGWIRTIIMDYLHIEGRAGTALSLMLRSLFMISIGFIILKILFKVRA